MLKTTRLGRTGLAMAALSLAGLSTVAFAQDKLNLEDTMSQVSYGIGLNIGQSMNAQGIEMNLEALFAGIQDSFTGQAPQLSEQQLMAAFQTWQQEQQAAVLALRDEQLQFLVDNKGNEGVVETESGLQYQVISTSGNERSPAATDVVRVHYHGTLIDGSVFDSSVQRDLPAEFPLNGVISGWTEGLQYMNIGDKFRFFIPYTLAYGEQGNQGIPPFATLIFDVELLDIVAQ